MVPRNHLIRSAHCPTRTEFAAEPVALPVDELSGLLSVSDRGCDMPCCSARTAAAARSVGRFRTAAAGFAGRFSWWTRFGR